MIFPKSDQVLDQKDPAFNVLFLAELRALKEAETLVQQKLPDLSSFGPGCVDYLHVMLAELLKAQRLRQFLCAHPNPDVRKTLLNLLQEGESRALWPDLVPLWTEYSKAQANPDTFANSDEIHDELSALDNYLNEFYAR